MHHSAKQRRSPRWIGALIAVFLIVAGAVGGSVVYAHRHEGRAPRGTTLMGQDVSGMNRQTLTALVSQRAASVSVTLVVEGTSTTVPLSQVARIDTRPLPEDQVTPSTPVMLTRLSTPLHASCRTMSRRCRSAGPSPR